MSAFSASQSKKQRRLSPYSKKEVARSSEVNHASLSMNEDVVMEILNNKTDKNENDPYAEKEF